MRTSFRKLLGLSIFPLLNIPLRAIATFFKYLGPELIAWFWWLIRSREDTNFTYNLTDINRTNLAYSVASIFNRPVGEIESYFSEIEGDQELDAHVKRVTASGAQRMRADREVRFGRRIAWYAIVRMLKPAVVIETGVDKGLGSVVLASAILRNRSEGHSGIYYGTDINPAAGYLFSGKYAEAGRILYGDSIVSLNAFSDPIDIFINDSDHSADYEAREYQAVASKLAESGLIIGDNAHYTDKLAVFSRRTNRRFFFLAEEPKAHWYRGGGIGLSLPAQV